MIDYSTQCYLPFYSKTNLQRKLVFHASQYMSLLLWLQLVKPAAFKTLTGFASKLKTAMGQGSSLFLPKSFRYCPNRPGSVKSVGPASSIVAIAGNTDAFSLRGLLPPSLITARTLSPFK